VLLTLAGWTNPRIAEAFCVREDPVRLWRSDFMSDGTRALKASVATGPAPVKSEAAMRVAPRCWKRPRPTGATGRSPDCVPRSQSGRRPHHPLATVQGVAKKVPLAAAAHTLNGHQSAIEVERAGLRLQLRKQQAEAGDIVLLYGDESEALTHPYLMGQGECGPGCAGAGEAKKVVMLGSQKQ
jgi:hypothetical protein